MIKIYFTRLYIILKIFTTGFDYISQATSSNVRNFDYKAIQGLGVFKVLKTHLEFQSVL